MKKINVSYWILTGLFAFLMLGSAIPDIVSSEIAITGFRQIGLPAYLVPFVGIAKALGVLAILVPGNPRLKEWAYAGLSFDLIGATYCIAASGQPVANWGFMVLPLCLAAAAYMVYQRRLRRAAAQAKAPGHETAASPANKDEYKNPGIVQPSFS